MHSRTLPYDLTVAVMRTDYDHFFHFPNMVVFLCMDTWVNYRWLRAIFSPSLISEKTRANNIGFSRRNATLSKPNSRERCQSVSSWQTPSVFKLFEVSCLLRMSLCLSLSLSYVVMSPKNRLKNLALSQWWPFLNWDHCLLPGMNPLRLANKSTAKRRIS